MIKRICKKLNCQHGAPMGRPNVGTRPEGVRIYDRFVPMSSCGAYDIGGAYWGLGFEPMRVAFTKDLSYIQFYRGRSRNDDIS